MFKAGDIVLATAGKEKGEKLMVVKSEQGYVYLADGKRLKAEKPKKKSIKHVKMFGSGACSIEERGFEPNARIRKILKERGV